MEHIPAEGEELFGAEIRAEQEGLGFCALSFESSESGVLAAVEETSDKSASQASGVVEVIDLILAEEETGGIGSKTDGNGFLKGWEQEFGARQERGGFADQVFSFVFVASHAIVSCVR